MTDLSPERPMTRVDRIAAAQAELDAIEPRWREIDDAYQRAKNALRKAQESFDVGERVHVDKLCSRLCCVRSSYTGTIAGMTPNGLYLIDADDGTQRDDWNSEVCLLDVSAEGQLL